MQTSRNNTRRKRRGFTLVELLIVVAVIMVLIGIMIPAMGKFHERALVTRSTSTLVSIQTGLQAFYADFNTYPPSAPAFGPIPGGRGSAMLAQGLIGYLDAADDGAGPSNGDPPYGFRTQKMGAGMSAMGRMGAIKGPYVTPDPKTFKFIKTATTTEGYFVDAWNHAILYFRSTRAPGADPVKLAGLSDPKATPGKIFGTGAMSDTNDYYFDSADCSSEKDEKGSSIPPPHLTAPPTPFFVQIGANSNTTFSNVLGARGFLLISAGPDGKYFTIDDIVMSK